MSMADAPATPQQGPYRPFPDEAIIVFDTFDGLNTAASRPAIEDAQQSWISGFFPLGKSNLRTMYGVGPPLYGPNTGNRVVFFDFGNIGATPICIVCLSDGSIQQVNTNTRAVTQIAPAGSIQNPSTTTIGITQWGSQYIVIVADQTNGLFIWDGVNLFDSGTLGPSVNITNNGLGYTSNPTITPVGGSGSGASFTSTVVNGIVQGVTVANPGGGYQGTDVVALAFSGGGSAGATAIAATTISSSTLASVSVTYAGLGYTSAVTATVQGGGGAGALVTVTASGGSIATLSILNGGAGFINPPTIVFEDPGNPVAQATVEAMPQGVGGTTAQTYQAHLWIAKQPRIQASAPGSLTDFATSDGGVAFNSTDPFLRVGFVRLVQTNGFLYLIADSSVNYISGVTTSGSPPETTFTNQNADPEIGSPWAPSVSTTSRNIIFGNPFGVHVSFGGAVTKVSIPLDGIYNTVPNFGGLIPSACKAIVFGRRIWCMLLPIVNPITGQQENTLLCWEPERKIWFTTIQDVPLVFVNTQEINSVLTAYGTDGETIYPLFQQPSTAFKKTVQSKLWDKPHYMHTKTQNRLWGLANYYDTRSPDLTIMIDNESGSASTTVTAGPIELDWFNSADQPILWSSTVGPFLWGTTALGVFVFPPTAIGQQGVLAGLTIETNAADMAIISISIDDEIWDYRG